MGRLPLNGYGFSNTVYYANLGIGVSREEYCFHDSMLGTEHGMSDERP